MLFQSDLNAFLLLLSSVIDNLQLEYILFLSSFIPAFSLFYFQLPVEVLTGEDADVMIMEDYFLIGNLQYFCWRIDFDRNLSISEELLKQIKIAIYKANIEIVNHIKNQNDLIYVLKLFDLDDEDNSSTLIDLFEKNIQLVTKGDYNEDHQSIEKLSKVFDYAINTKNLIDKKTYNSIVNILYPLVECYKNNPE